MRGGVRTEGPGTGNNSVPFRIVVVRDRVGRHPRQRGDITVELRDVTLPDVILGSLELDLSPLLRVHQVVPLLRIEPSQ